MNRNTRANGNATHYVATEIILSTNCSKRGGVVLENSNALIGCGSTHCTIYCMILYCTSD